MSTEVREYVRVYFTRSVAKNSERDKSTRLDAGPDRRLYRDMSDPLTLRHVGKHLSADIPWTAVDYAIEAPAPAAKAKKAAE